MRDLQPNFSESLAEYTARCCPTCTCDRGETLGRYHSYGCEIRQAYEQWSTGLDAQYALWPRHYSETEEEFLVRTSRR